MFERCANTPVGTATNRTSALDLASRTGRVPAAVSKPRFRCPRPGTSGTAVKHRAVSVMGRSRMIIPAGSLAGWTSCGVSLLERCSTRCYSCGMSQVVTQRELRNGSGEIMRRLDEGESFVVTRNGVPVGELTPLRRLRFVTAKSIAQVFQTAPPIDGEQFRRDLDAFADQDIEPRG